jgi:hypothetical protein
MIPAGNKIPRRPVVPCDPRYQDDLIPISLFAGAVTLLITHRLARAFVAWWRGRLKGPTEE